MVVTGLHLLSGARADADRGALGRGSGRGRGPFRHSRTRRRGDHAGGRDPRFLRRRPGRRRQRHRRPLRQPRRPSRAHLGGRSVPAKSLSGFTNALLTLHGQNDQLRLLRPDQQRAALDRYGDAVGQLARKYRALRDEWLEARRRARRPPPPCPRAGAGGRPAPVRAQRDRRCGTTTRRGRRDGRRHPPAVGTRFAA